MMDAALARAGEVASLPVSWNQLLSARHVRNEQCKDLASFAGWQPWYKIRLLSDVDHNQPLEIARLLRLCRGRPLPIQSCSVTQSHQGD